MRHNRSRSVQGSVIAYALVVIATASLLLVSIVGFIVSQIKGAAHAESSEQAFQIAESGIHFYKWYLAHETDGRNAQEIQAFWTSSAYGVGTSYEAEYADPLGDPVGRYRITVTPPEADSTIAWVESEGWTYNHPDLRRTIRVRFRQPSWSEYATLANLPDETGSNSIIRFGTGTEVYGKIHANRMVRFDGLAHSLVTSAAAEGDDPDHSGGNEFGVHTHVNPPPGSGVNDSFRPDEAPPNSVPSRPDVFEGGRAFPVAAIDFGGLLSDLSLMRSEAQSGNGVYFDRSGHGRHIFLQPDGTFDVCRVRRVNSGNSPYRYYRNSGGGSCSSCSGSCLSTYDIPDDGVIYVEDDVWLSGRIDGQRVTVVGVDLDSDSAEPSVYIQNDLLYTQYDGTETIGVIGETDIEIPRASEDDLRIDAALLAQKGRVGREYYTRCYWWGCSYVDTRDTITVYGAIATNLRYGFAYIDGTGYQIRNLLYDNNLLYSPPPYFPTTQYIIDLWEEL